MGPVDAFAKLNYRPRSRYAWSVVSETGCCLALWRDEISWKRESTPVFDTRCDAGQSNWRDDPKAAHRLEHLKIALERWGGRVDMIVRDGTPEKNDGTAEPWFPENKKAWWVCSFLDVAQREFVVRVNKTGANT